MITVSLKNERIVKFSELNVGEVFICVENGDSTQHVMMKLPMQSQVVYLSTGEMSSVKESAIVYKIDKSQVFASGTHEVKI